MTPKVLARPEKVLKYAKWCPTLVTQDGRKFTWAHLVKDYVAQLEVGETVMLAHRLNVPTEDWCFEIYPVTIAEDQWMKERGRPNYPHTWFGNGRSIVVEIR